MDRQSLGVVPFVRLTVVVMMSVLLTGCSVFGVRSGYEQAPYTVIERLGEDAEVRGYPAQVIAEASVAATDERAGRNQAFRKLFDYISGGNRSAETIAMTTPVETGAPAQTIAMTVPVETTTPAAGEVTMRFFLPASFTLATAPRPTDPAVRIVELPERTLAVETFTGSTGAENVAKHRADLETKLAHSRWRPAGEPMTMFYDPPWTIPFLRRNEVAIPVVPIE